MPAPAGAVSEAAAATGGSLTGVTVIVTVVSAVPPRPSETRTPTVSVPWKSAAGV